MRLVHEGRVGMRCEGVGVRVTLWYGGEVAWGGRGEKGCCVCLFGGVWSFFFWGMVDVVGAIGGWWMGKVVWWRSRVDVGGLGD